MVMEPHLDSGITEVQYLVLITDRWLTREVHSPYLCAWILRGVGDSSLLWLKEHQFQRFDILKWERGEYWERVMAAEPIFIAVTEVSVK